MEKQVAKVNKVRSRDERTFQRIRSDQVRNQPTPSIQDVNIPWQVQNQPTPSNNDGNNPWVIVWILAGLLTMFIPRIIWSVKKSYYFNAYGSAIYAEDYYEEQKRYYENNNNGNYYGNYNQNAYTTCNWYNWLACRKKQYYFATYEERANGEMVPDIPNWYLFFGGETEDMTKWIAEMNGEEENDFKEVGNESGFNFVYGLTIWMFIAMLVYGVIVIGKRKPVSSLLIVLGFSFSMALSNAIMSVQGAISSENEALENSYYGWYGQLAVLLAYTDIWIMGFSGCFLIALIIKMFVERASVETKTTTNEGDYHAPENIQMT